MGAHVEGKYEPGEARRQGTLLAWVDERLPLTKLWRRHFSEYPVPKNLNIWYVFGVLAVLVLVIQVLTGIFLAMFYKPDAALNENGLPAAFASLGYIMNDVNWGWLIRTMHSTGASAFFVVAYLHMFRSLLYGSYRQPRELVWILGMLVYLLLTAEAFTGTVLPWGQISYWGAQVIINLFSVVPWVGETLATWVRGDYVLGGDTLGRFFALHVIAIPLALCGLVALHIAALRQVGSNNPEGIEIGGSGSDKGISADTIPFHPYYTVKDFAAAAVFLTVFFAVVFFAPEGGGYFLKYGNFSPADPLKPPQNVVPIWYFAPFYSILRSVTWTFFGLEANFWGAAAMGGSVAVMIFLPWLDRSPVRSIRYRGPMHKCFLASFVAAFLALGYLGLQPFSPVNQAVSQFCTLVYFSFFLLMPWYSRIDKCRPAPERLSFR